MNKTLPSFFKNLLYRQYLRTLHLEKEGLSLRSNVLFSKASYHCSCGAPLGASMKSNEGKPIQNDKFPTRGCSSWRWTTDFKNLQRCQKRGFSKVGFITTDGKSLEIEKSNREILSKLLGVEPVDVKRVPYTKLIEEVKVVALLKVLKEFGFPATSILVYPELLRMPVAAIENYIRIMNESGFPSIREAQIIRFRVVCRQTMSVLQQKLLLPHINRVIQKSCDELEMEESFVDEFIKSLPDNHQRLTLLELRTNLIASYLAKLELGTLDKLTEKISKHPRLAYRSLNWIKRNYKILKTLEFGTERIMSHFYLLHIDANNLTEIASIKSLAGMSLKEIATRRPKILTNNYKTLVSIEEALTKHNIPFDSVYKYPEIYTLSSATILKRLEEMDTIPEFELLKTHPNVARLLYYHNKAKSRLQEFRSHQIRSPSLYLLSSDSKIFEKCIASGDIRLRGVDIIIYLAGIFKVDKKRVRESLLRHPHWLNAPLVSLKSALNYIQTIENFSNDQLIDAIPLLLYPVSKIEKGIQDVLNSGEAKPSDPYFLQMVLYFIEKPSHFSGDAVWDEGVHEYEEEMENECNSSARRLEE